MVNVQAAKSLNLKNFRLYGIHFCIVYFTTKDGERVFMLCADNEGKTWWV